MKSVTISICVFAVVAACGGADVAWHDEKDYRWAELDVPKTGKTGFTLLPPDQTGITFINTLDDQAAASNRVLYNGSGVAAGDFDNDGLCDLYFCHMLGHNKLYKNLGHWKFKDVTEEAGVDCDGEICRAAVFADINGDGWLDLLVSTTGHGVIVFLNDGHGHFQNITKEAGTSSRYGSVTMALADVDGNGTLDLYVANNRKEDIKDRGQADLQMLNGHLIIPPWYKDRLVLINDQLMEYGEPDIVYRNDGKGHFTPIPWTDGTFLDEDGKPLTKPPLDWGLTVTFRDLNGDGAPDIYEANDYWTPDRCWLNDGHGHFRALDRLALRETSHSAMGVDFADIDRDGHLDFMVVDMLARDHQHRLMQQLVLPPFPQQRTQIDGRPQINRNTFFHNRGDGTFEELANFSGLPASEWSWQPLFLDVDLDGYEDLLVTSGHARDVQDIDTNNHIKDLQAKHELVPDGFTLTPGKPLDRQERFSEELRRGMLMYPRLDTPIVTFHNKGGLQFEEVTAAWGLDTPGIHHGVALADFDGDGDLDFVCNNLGSVAGVYRNNTSAPRVAVRLKGLAPNTQGIGATIKLLGGAVPMQSQEVISGGRYLSGSDPMLVFAAGHAEKDMLIQVTWRNGKISIVRDVKPNRLYEVNESGAQTIPLPAGAPPMPPLFTDVSDLLHHTHHENDFDDFQRQPLLPNKLSQLGPGVAWHDVNGDGFDDLIIGSGQDGSLTMFLNDGKGGFTPLAAPVATRDQTGIVAWTEKTGRSSILVGSANYEDGAFEGESALRFTVEGGKLSPAPGLPGVFSSTGPIALADVDGDGALDVFIGGRVQPGRWPEPASSRLYRGKGGKFVYDDANSAKFAALGMVTGAVFSDLNGDGFPDLVVTLEWGPVRIFMNDGKGNLSDATEKLGLAKFKGWWNGVTVGDLDGDGRLDIIATNWGRNSKYEHHYDAQHPLQMFFGDFAGKGAVDLIESYFDKALSKQVPERSLTEVAASMPFARLAMPTYKQYGASSIEEIFGAKLHNATALTATTLDHMVFFNRGDHFDAVPLPREAQVAPAFGVSVGDLDGDGHEDVFITQNFFPSQPATPRCDAGRSLWLKGDSKGSLVAMPGQVSGVKVYGDARGCALADFDCDGRVDVVVAQNSAITKLYRNIGGKPGLRVRLNGPPGNPDGIGATIRLMFGDQLGPAREVHAGSGYWSQDSAVQVMGRPEPPTKIWVRWPGGKVTTSGIAAGAKQIVVGADGSVNPMP